MEFIERSFTLRERLILFYYSTKKKLESCNEVGKTKISLLFIPHSQENIVKIELSVYLIAFLLFISLFLSFISFGYFVSYVFIKKDNDKIYQEGNMQKVYFLHYDLMADELDDITKEMIKNTKKLNKATWGKNELDFNIFNFNAGIFDMEQISSLDKDMESNVSIFNTTVKKYENLGLQLSNLKSKFENAIDYIDTREGIYQSMPSGRPLAPNVGIITSTFGYRADPFNQITTEFHRGIDFASSSGTPIYATAPGIVADRSDTALVGGLGLSIKLYHSNGFITVYGHCSEIHVNPGDIVKRGDRIGSVGATGKATGPHVHYEVHIGSDPPFNPSEFINLN
ncbi:MAG: peptidoglycan DD-metalloendopeptidase family protein [Leptospiraceae bacterium]|nr:peptidoglycan DD-metalloendopeptidase family protein [Leptospiraceae bacterium]MCP5497734.1 peptidoglycan DD-metalloendopeptidase family protein [Leptospiraceae bacterium]